MHDVTPAHAQRLDVLYDLLAELAVTRYALLVVPDWHGGWPLERFGDFAAALTARARAGAEIVLHGLRHDEVGQARTLAHWARTYGRTAREGEFASLAPTEAGARIERGLAVLHGVRLEPIGFVPPAWLGGPELARVVREAGLAFIEDTRAIVAVGRTGPLRRIRAPATCWSTRPPRWRAAGSVVVAALRLRLERHRPLVRVALHPSDVASPAVLASCRRTLAALLETRQLTSYGEVMGRWADGPMGRWAADGPSAHPPIGPTRR